MPPVTPYFRTSPIQATRSLVSSSLLSCPKPGYRLYSIPSLSPHLSRHSSDCPSSASQPNALLDLTFLVDDIILLPIRKEQRPRFDLPRQLLQRHPPTQRKVCRSRPSAEQMIQSCSGPHTEPTDYDSSLWDTRGDCLFDERVDIRRCPLQARCVFLVADVEPRGNGRWCQR